jgi:hypothetical protein
MFRNRLHSDLIMVVFARSKEPGRVCISFFNIALDAEYICISEIFCDLFILALILSLCTFLLFKFLLLASLVLIL